MSETPSKYATLLETNEAEMEAWMYFIRYEGNEEALRHLQNQLEQVEFYILEGMSTFDLELDYLVSETTAKEMTKVDLNSHSFHRKFDGKLEMINFDFRKRDGNETKICKCFDILGYGQIEDYIDQEDIDPEDLVVDGEEEEEVTTEEEEEEKEEEKPAKGGIPRSLLTSKLPDHVRMRHNRR
jgi:hypothetical protein